MDASVHVDPPDGSGLERLVRLIPPPSLHRHRYAGTFAANSPLRPYVIKSAGPDEHLAHRLQHAARQMDLLDSARKDNPEQHVPQKENIPGRPKQFPELLSQQPATATAIATGKPTRSHRARRRASILWAMLIARIYEALPLICRRCRSPMKPIAFITEPFTIQKILSHIGLPTQPPRLSTARDPPQVHIDFQHEHQRRLRYDPYDQTHWP